MAASPAPRRTRSSDSSCGSYGMPRPPPASTSRTVVPVAWARRRADRTVAATWATSAPASRTFEAPKAWSPEQVEVGRGRGAPRRRDEVRRHPSRTCPRRRRRPDGRARAARPPRPRPAAGSAGRRPASAAIASRRPSSPGDSTVTARIPAATAARSSSSRLPGPVMTTRPGSIPARSTAASSPPDATSAPSPRPPEMRDDRERRVRLDRVGQVHDRRAGTIAARRPGGR